MTQPQVHQRRIPQPTQTQRFLDTIERGAAKTGYRDINALKKRAEERKDDPKSVDPPGA